jgi:hypothetical protein
MILVDQVIGLGRRERRRGARLFPRFRYDVAGRLKGEQRMMAYLLLKREQMPERCTKGQDPGQPQKRPMKSSLIFIPLGADILFCGDVLPGGTGEMVARLVREAEATSQIGLAA